MTTQTKCSEKVWAGGGYGSHQCRNSGKVERDGKWYCGLHDPVAVKAKQDASMTRIRLKFDAKDKVRAAEKAKQAEIERRADCYPDLLDALQNLLKVWEGVDGARYGARAIAKAAIEKATGVSSDQR